MLRRTFLAVVASGIVAMPAFAQDARTLNIGFISTESSSNLKSAWQPLIDDLSKTLGVTVKPFFASDYAGIIEGKGIFSNIPKSELRPGPIKSFEGRKFCGSLSGSSMYMAARMGCGNMVLMLPQRGKDVAPDKYTAVWQEVHGAGSTPPPPMLGGNYYVDESADYAQEQGEKYLAHTMRAAIKNYHLDTPGKFPHIKGYEHYENMVLAPEAIEPYVAEFAKGAVTGTPQMILDRMWELKEQFKPQGFFPHVYYGGMPQEEARKNMELFAKKVLPELKSWEAETSIDDRFLEAAE